jgi:UDP-N-acetylglucosamine/UDP-N-acetylgalactosamine diphosphorylase
VANNIAYLANLVALEQWYAHVRQPFFAVQELGGLICEGAMEMLALAKRERAQRLIAMAAKVPSGDAGGQALRERGADVCALFDGEPPAAGRQDFLAAFEAAAGGDAGASSAVRRDYRQTIQQLPGDVVAAGVSWLQQVVDSLCEQAAEQLQPLCLFQDR